MKLTCKLCVISFSLAQIFLTSASIAAEQFVGDRPTAPVTHNTIHRSSNPAALYAGASNRSIRNVALKPNKLVYRKNGRLVIQQASYLGSSPYIYTPSGFGQRSTFRIRG